MKYMFFFQSSPIPALANLKAPLFIIGLPLNSGAPIAQMRPTPSLLRGSLSVSFDAEANLLAATILNTSTIAGIKIGKNSYQAAISKSELKPGQYYLELETRKLLVFPYLGETGKTAKVEYLKSSYPPEIVLTNEILEPVPTILKTINPKGEIRIRRSFEDSPNLEIEYVHVGALKSEQQKWLNGTIIEFWGMNYVLVNSSWEILPKLKYPHGSIARVTLNFQGIHASINSPSRASADLPILLRNLGNTGVLRREGIEAEDRYIPIANIASAAGIFYAGKSFTIKIDKNSRNEATTTFRQELEENVQRIGGFIYYSNSRAIEARTFGATSRHLLSEAEVIEAKAINRNGAGYLYENVQLSHEYRNVQLQIDREEEDNKEGQEAEGRVVRWEFENARDFQEVISSPKGKEILREPGNAFDVGGYTRKARKFVEFNGSPISEESVTFGFAFSSLDTYAISKDAETDEYKLLYLSNLNPQNFWKEVESTTTNFHYDDEGYLIGQTTKGKRLARYLQDSENLAAGNAFIDFRIAEDNQESADEKARLTKIYKSYQFEYELPIFENTQYILERFIDYYPDTPTKKKEDKNFITPRFAKRKIREEDSSTVIENPRSTEDNPLRPIVQIKRFIEYVSTEIVSKSPEKFRIISYTSAARGEGGKNNLTIASASDNRGRPPVQQRRDRASNLPPKKQNPPPTKNYNYFLNTPGVKKEAGVIEQSISINSNNPEEGRIAAETKIRIQNSQTAQTLALDVRYSPFYSEGDLIDYLGETWVIFSIDIELKLDNLDNSPKIYCNRCSLNLGKLIMVPVTLSKTEIR